MLRRTDGRITDVVGLLDDADATVRTGIAESIGTRGADAVAPLRAVVDGGVGRRASRESSWMASSTETPSSGSRRTRA